MGEINRLSRSLELEELCACGLPVRACPFWSVVLTDLPISSSTLAYQSGLNFLLDRNYYFEQTPERRKYVDPAAYRAFHKELYNRVLATANKVIICDSSKDVDRAELLLADPDLDLTLIHLTRDGRGVAYSYKKKKGTRSAYRFMYEWMATNLKIALLRRRHPEAEWLLMRYEDLVANPERELRRVLEAVGAPYEPAMLDFKALPHHHLGGNRRFRTQTASVLSADESWQQGLTWLEKAYFAVFFSWMNRY